MENTLNVELVTPEKLYYSAEADMVIAPGTLGEFGALYGHMPFVSTLKAGVVSVHQGVSVTRFFIAGGVAEVNPTSCTILAEEVIDISRLTLADAQARLQAARQKQDMAIGDVEQQLADKSVQLSEALVEAVA